MDNIQDKLNKLEAMMNDSGASEGERANAFKLFEKLVANYNVDLTKRKTSNVIDHKSSIAFSYTSWMVEYHSIMTQYARYFNVYAVLSQTNEYPTLKYFKYIGKEEDIVMLDYMYTQTVRQFTQMFRFKLFSKNAKGILGEFLIELTRIINHKIFERNEYFKSGAQGEGLILIRKNEIDTYKNIYKEKYGAPTSTSPKITTNGAKGVGASVAKGINFNRPLNGGKSNLQLK